jgi:hypothetical protein
MLPSDTMGFFINTQSHSSNIVLISKRLGWRIDVREHRDIHGGLHDVGIVPL